MKTKPWSVGIDIAKDKFDVCIKYEDASKGRSIIKGSRHFDNTEEGFKSFWSWVNKRTQIKSQLIFVMEATGIYYENLAYYLYGKKVQVCVELATKVKYYAKSKNVKTKTDKVDAEVLADMGLERKLKAWQPMSAQYRELREMSRLMLSYKQNMSGLKSQLHAMNHAHQTSEIVLKVHQKQISFYQQSVDELEEQCRIMVNQDKVLCDKIEKISTLKGVSFITILSVICETNGFALFENIRQVVSYAGLDVKADDSGNRIGKSRIGKSGNARIRASLYMPTLSAIRCNNPIKALHKRVCEKHPDTKMKGVVAGMRKLLVLIYVLWKKDEAFDENYQWTGKK